MLNAALIFAALFLAASAPELPHARFESDFRYAVEQIRDTYAYFDVKATRWDEVAQRYAPDLASVRTKRQFIALLEHVMDELYDSHAQLTVNTPSSPRLVPSGTDLWAEWRDGSAVITEVRAGSDAERAGIQPGAVVVSLNGVAIATCVDSRMGRTYPHSTTAARDWALRAVLAGHHGEARTLRLRERGIERGVELPARDQFGGPPAAKLKALEVRPGVGYIRFNDSLGDDQTVSAFDEALNRFHGTRALVIDLRDTPSGGNTSVARGILGRFVSREVPYQKHVLPSEERTTGIRRSWLELVSPRGPFTYEEPLFILVDHWTGSMGEGVAIGFDAAAHATVAGTRMAGLLGATYHITLPATGFGLNVPAERLYHVNGTPREEFKPRIEVDLNGAKAGEDRILDAALGAVK